MAKERKTRDIKSLLAKKAPLPSKTEVKKSVAKVTGKPIKIVDNEEVKKIETPTKPKKQPTQKKTVVEKKERGRPKKGHGRVKFTTIIEPNKRDELKILAIRQGRNVADILDELIDIYLKKHK